MNLNKQLRKQVDKLELPKGIYLEVTASEDTIIATISVVLGETTIPLADLNIPISKLKTKKDVRIFIETIKAFIEKTPPVPSEEPVEEPEEDYDIIKHNIKLIDKIVNDTLRQDGIIDISAATTMEKLLELRSILTEVRSAS